MCGKSRERDYGPAHVHLTGGGFDVIIDLVSLVTDGEWPRGLREGVLVWVSAHRKELMEEWQQWHP
jgi:hypothetical protein